MVLTWSTTEIGELKKLPSDIHFHRGFFCIYLFLLLRRLKQFHHQLLCNLTLKLAMAIIHMDSKIEIYAYDLPRAQILTETKKLGPKDHITFKWCTVQRSREIWNGATFCRQRKRQDTMSPVKISINF